jgi:AraC-like DNA-binding protein
MSLTELSCVLGFADASSFSRAFRKWYGVSATEYKKRE